MKIERHRSKWGNAIHLGPYAEWQDWNIWHHVFDIGFYIGTWILYLQFTLWDIEEEIQILEGRGMTREEAWNLCDGVRHKLPDPYDGRVNMRKEIEKVWSRGLH